MASPSQVQRMSTDNPSADVGDRSASVQAELRSITAALTTARGRLRALASSLPEEELEGEEEESGPGLRSIISCVLTDALDIAIRDLGRAAEQEATAEGDAAGHTAR